MFSKETEYALRGLVYIHLQNLKGRRPGTVEIVGEIGSPRYFTAKILQRLARHGFITSLKGKGGGFYINSERPDLTIKELMSITEGKKDFTCCGLGQKKCNSYEPCPLHEQYVPIREAMEKLVSTETIQSLSVAKDKSPRK
jgi:Rrf2 family protein